MFLCASVFLLFIFLSVDILCILSINLFSINQSFFYLFVIFFFKSIYPFQGENLPLVLGRADQHGEISNKLYNSEEIIALDTVPGNNSGAGKAMPSSLKQPCTTFRAQNIYSKFNNQILVKLVGSTEKKSFGKAKIQLNQEFLKLISSG